MSFDLRMRESGGTSRTEGQALQVLVSGASFAGLATAFWMNRLGYAVTVVEIAKGLKMGGSPVDIKGRTVEIVRRMGLLERIQASSLKAKPVEFLDAGGGSIVTMPARSDAEQALEPEYEIERDALLQMMFEAVEGEVEFLFGESIASLEDAGEEVAVRFRSGEERTFSLVFGCDGHHSNVRRMCFGEESAYTHFLEHYSAISIVDRLLIEEDTAQMYNVPGKVVMLSAYNGKTDIIFSFYSEEEIPYDYRDQDEQWAMILQQFRGEGWRTPELLEAAAHSGNFYFDKVCQIRMPSWTKGRVALVGDAAYCASPAAGMGGSLAIIGATALADAMARSHGDVAAAFQEYDDRLRPFVEQVQAEAIHAGLAMFVPDTEEELRMRNEQLGAGGA